MPLYVWVIPAFLKKGSPVDHTWATSYDSRHNPYTDIGSIKKANEKYWYCWGSFHPSGKPVHPILSWNSSATLADCLVQPNDPKRRGTIHWYGIDGVCHQVTNQILYITSTPNGGKPMVVRAARGYLLSSSLFDTYGRRKKEWNKIRIACGIAPASASGPTRGISLMTQRMTRILQASSSDPRVVQLESLRRRLLSDLDEIGFATRGPNETAQDRVEKMNQRINYFLRDIRNLFPDERGFIRMFGISWDEEIFLIDPELFEFPDPRDRPERNSVEGW